VPVGREVDAVGEPTVAEAIEHTRQEIARLKAQLIALEDAAERLRAPSGNARKARHSKTGVARDEIKPGSYTAKAVEVFLEVRRTLPVDDLLKRMADKGKAPPKASLVGALARYVKKGRIFYRPKPGVYGLLELKGG